ncbi:hypothetical protein L6164_033250 [Bauhinia variegata]|uniref:Uncharacterized protein n=1 Tax=Bauhinia variegata TaxID=167791 RepID=A0ACB9KRW2_BAUVA|nr:hypothetical protein L6164_033250 [Bauhinia variegata]
MCSSIFGPIMDNYQGDLTDIIRASGGAYGGNSSSSSCGTVTASSISDDHNNNNTHNTLSDHWHYFSSNSDPMMSFSSAMEEQRVNFGDPFSNMRDPFLHHLDMIPASAYLNSAGGNSAETITFAGGTEEAAAFAGANTNTTVSTHKVLEDDMGRLGNSIFSGMIQISPNVKLPVSPGGSPAMAVNSPRVVKPSPVVPSNMINANCSKNCLVDNTGVQISSPRNPGLKRRKSQAKKVVCIPAPVAPNSRPSGEVVPSDLWAWRKYGQKPIKGSPYPRGYYRCSSSKGCSARKQVERSRTDPNMLVITYTSEHNHPWPIQRNALAGSTRSQPSKNNASSKNSEAQKGSTTKPKEEQQESNSDSNVSPVVGGGSNSTNVKEEMEDIENLELEMDDGEFPDGISYNSSIPDHCNQSEDFFAELGEIEADPLDLLFTQGFNAAADHAQRPESKGLDPFHFFDWSGPDNNKQNNSFEETGRGL